MRKVSIKRVFLFSAIVFSISGAFLIFSRDNKAPLNIEDLPTTNTEDVNLTQYLAFQIFTSSFDSTTMRSNIPPPSKSIADTVDDIIRSIGTIGSKSRKLGFIPGPLSFDHTNEQIRQLMRDSFSIALSKNIAVGFHIDDSMFWGRLSHLNKTEHIEWLDWSKTVNTGRRLDWSSTPTKIMPQLCLNSPVVMEEVKKRAELIAEEIMKGLAAFKVANKEHLFIGIISGWETQIGRDFETGKYLGYCALANKGFNEQNPPANINEARVDIVKEFIDFWSGSLANAGVPERKIFSHIAFMSKTAFDIAKFGEPSRIPGSYLEVVNFSPVRVSFGNHHYPGFSTYPQFGHLEEVQKELAKKGNVPWASSEGTEIDPSAAERGDAGVSMETYLGNLFNHGATLVNIFGWGVGQRWNPFRKVAESEKAIEAYQKFLRGQKLREDVGKNQIPSPQFFSKLRKLQKELPLYLKEHGPEKVGSWYEKLEEHLKAQRYNDAEKVVDELLKLILIP